MIEIGIGFIISLAIAMTGVGAGTITAPVLILFLGVDPAPAIGTALLFSLVVKVPVGFSYFANRKVNREALTLMCLGGVPGVIVGSLFLDNISNNPEIKQFVLGGIGLIVFISSLLNLIFSLKGTSKNLFFYPKKWVLTLFVPLGRRQNLGGQQPSLVFRGALQSKSSNSTKNVDNIWKKIIPFATFIIGLEVGFSSAGAGAMGTLLLLAATTLMPQQVVGTDIIFGLALSLVGGIFHFSMGHLDTNMLFFLSIGALGGIPLGLYASSRVPAEPLKRVLLLWIVFIGIMLIVRAFE